MDTDIDSSYHQHCCSISTITTAKDDARKQSKQQQQYGPTTTSESSSLCAHAEAQIAKKTDTKVTDHRQKRQQQQQEKSRSWCSCSSMSQTISSQTQQLLHSHDYSTTTRTESAGLDGSIGEPSPLVRQDPCEGPHAHQCRKGRGLGANILFLICPPRCPCLCLPSAQRIESCLVRLTYSACRNTSGGGSQTCSCAECCYCCARDDDSETGELL